MGAVLYSTAKVRMIHDEVFLQAILDAPEDDTPRLVYADWLEEQGETRAAALRAYPEISRLLARLKTATQAPYDVLERHAAAGRVDFLSALGLLIERGRNLLHNQKWPGILDSMVYHLERLLALTPSQASADTLAQGLHDRPQTPARIRSLSSLLASRQPQGVLLKLFERSGSNGRFAELLACLAREMVLRIGDVQNLPPLVRFVQEIRAEEHPLTYLPLALVGIERHLRSYLPNENIRGRFWSMPFETSRQLTPRMAPETPDGPITVWEVNDAALTSRISAAVRNWQEESNGQVEVRMFRPARPITEGDLTAAFLQSLGLECLQGSEVDRIRAERIPVQQAVSTLFASACNGGAYNYGLFGAYGRLETWRSLMGLVGAPDTESVKAIATLAERCSWFSVDASSEWFYHIAWDFGLVVIRPDGMSLAVLAATDTD